MEFIVGFIALALILFSVFAVSYGVGTVLDMFFNISYEFDRTADRAFFGCMFLLLTIAIIVLSTMLGYGILHGAK